MTILTPVEQGLTAAQVEISRSKNGPNKIEKEDRFFSLRLLFSQFRSPLVYILIFAGITTCFLKEFTDAVVIFSAVLINTVLGFYQEKKAQKTLSALNLLIVHQVEVIRDGLKKIIEASEVVPGDLVVLAMGNRIPADGIVRSAIDLSLNEAILTGESMPVKKTAINAKEEISGSNLKKENLVYGGTTVASGKGIFQVTAVGEKSEMGKIGGRLKEIREGNTPLQEQLAKVAKILAVVVATFSAAIFAGGGILGYGWTEVFIISVAVAVAAIPEGLVVSLTVILALGMQNILRRKALVRKLLAAETLGSVSIICVDKTGTLTEGKMKVVKADWEDENQGFLAAALCSEVRDPIGVATWEWARKYAEKKQKNIEEILEKNPRLDEIPFSPQTKMMVTLHPDFLLVAGAPELVLGRCRLSKESQRDWSRKFEDFARRGYRLVGYARKESKEAKKTINKKDLEDLAWLGVLIFEDPVREGVKEALYKCRQAGIKVKVITGDYLPTAMAVLEQLGMDGQEAALTGEEVESFNEEELKKMIDRIVLFARTTPEQKLKIVKALKEKGEVVAMTGDGVNDALALKMADIGIVVGEASDVAKETADMVLLDSNFATIVRAIEEGRTIFENVKKVTLFLLTDAFTEVLLIGGSLLLGLPLPVTAAQILWVNLIEDTLPGMALAFEKGEREVMDLPPRERKAPILDTELKVLIFIIGTFLNVVLLLLFFWLYRSNLDFEHIQTLIFVALAIDSLFVCFSCRSLKKSIIEYNPFANKPLTASIIICIFLLGAAVYFPPLQVLLKTRPLAAQEWAIVLGLGIFSLLMIEAVKWIFIAKVRILKKNRLAMIK